MFWNIHGLTKDKIGEIREYVKRFEIIILVETFVEEKNFEKLEQHLPKEYEWKWISATRERQRGRAIAGSVMGIKKGLRLVNFWTDSENCCLGGVVEINDFNLRVIGVYNRTGIRKIREVIGETLENTINEYAVLLGDWNARTGELGGVNELQTRRVSQDKVVDGEGREFIELLDDYDYTILNGRSKGDWQGRYTHTDYRSQSVLDYATCNGNTEHLIKSLVIANRSESDHYPLEITMDVNANMIIELPVKRVILDRRVSALEKYNKRMKRESLPTDTPWSDISAKIESNLQRRTVSDEPPKNPWWNKDCEKVKEVMLAILEFSRIIPELTPEFLVFKKIYKRQVKQAKRELSEVEIEKLREVKGISEAWKYLKCKQKICQSPGPSNKIMAEHFCELLEGMTEQPEPEDVWRRPVDVQEIGKEELERGIKKLKSGKAVGPDGIPAEALIWADNATKEAIRRTMNRCLHGENIPEEWRKARIHPLHKKGDPQLPGNYRGISIGSAPYKLFASILNTRLETVVEEKGMLPDTQNGFRRNRCTMDNIYILNHIAQKYLSKRKPMFCAFIDFKAAFDTIDRKKLYDRLTKLQIPEYLLHIVKNIYRKTQNTIGDQSFFTTKGLRQGCPLSPLLFALYIGDLEQTLKNQQAGGVPVGRTSRVQCLAYADDLVLMAETGNELKEMLKVLQKYTERRGLIVNVAKSKVLRFSGSGRLSGGKWIYGGEEMEEVRSFKYLGFVFQIKGIYSEHIKDRESAGRIAVSKTWSLAERKFPDHYRIRRQMFDSLVMPIMNYGCEVTGFKTREGLEVLQRKYFRWTLGLNQGTKKEILWTEAGIQPLHLSMGRRALAYERRSLKSPCQVLRLCVEEVQSGIEGKWAQDRRRFCESGGMSEATVKQRCELLENVEAEVTRTRIQAFEQGVERVLRNRRYAAIRAAETPKYLKGTFRQAKLVARFRCENEEWGNIRWRGDGTCRICGNGPDTLEHQSTTCAVYIGSVNNLLCESGRGWKNMERLIKERCK